MTSEYGNATTADQFSLIFDDEEIGDWVESWEPKFKRITDISRIHNLWTNTVLLDASFPALLWTHTFTLYKEGTVLKDYVDSTLDLADQIKDTPKPLVLRCTTMTSASSAGSLSFDVATCVAFGACVLDQTFLHDPQELLLHTAGLFKVRFIGTEKPITEAGTPP